MLERTQIEQIISKFRDPYLGQDWLSAKCVRDVLIDAEKVVLQLQLGYPLAGVEKTLEAALLAELQTLAPTIQLQIEWQQKLVPHPVQTGVKGLSGVKNIIAVASGKGGVGKSTTAVNLALALQQAGARVGILDADIYGPNQPHMLGVGAVKPQTNAEGKLLPVVSHGLQSMSIGYVIEQDKAMIWRGPMVSKVLQQLLFETAWDDLDYLIVDLPPGTGDVQLTMAQKIPVSGAVIVTTPQDIALLDAEKAVAMFNKVNITTLGVIENMSVHVCSQCGHVDPVFGDGGGERFANEHGVELLAQLPLDISIRRYADQGIPTVVVEPNSDIAQIYREAARKIAGRLSLRGKDYSRSFPNVVVTAE